MSISRFVFQCRRFLAVSVLTVAALIGSAPGCQALLGPDCKSEDPGCDVTLFLLQYLAAGTQNVASHLYLATTTQIEVYSIERSSGVLSLESTFSVGNSMNKLVVDSNGRILHAGGVSSPGGLHSFRLDNPVAPTALPGNALTAPAGRGFTQITPNGRYVYAANNTDVDGYVVDVAAGTRTQIPGMPLGTGCINANAIDARGEMYYDHAALAGFLRGFRIDAATGALTLASSVTEPVFMRSMAVENQRRYLYTGTLSNSTTALYGYALDASGAPVGPLAGSPFTVTSATDSVYDIAIDSRSRFLYTANLNTDSVSMLRIDSATGAVSPIAAPLGVGNAPSVVALSPDERFLYTVYNNGAGVQFIGQYQVNSDGSLGLIGSTQTNVSSQGRTIDFLFNTELR